MFLLGILSTAFDMPYYWLDSIGEQVLWKELVSAVFLVLFVLFMVVIFLKKDRDAIRGLSVYGTVCLVGCIPLFPWFTITGLGLFQPAFSLLGKLLSGSEINAVGMLGPILAILIATVLTWLGLIGIPPEKKETSEKGARTKT